MFSKIRNWFTKRENKTNDRDATDGINEIANTMLAAHVDRFVETVAYHVCCGEMLEFCYRKNISKHTLFKAIRMSGHDFEGSFAQYLKDYTTVINWTQRQTSFENIDRLLRFFTHEQLLEKKCEIDTLLNDKQKSAELAKCVIDFVATNKDKCSFPWYQY